jgi:endonuclease/exonuclease/phosphatase family metal-dependent hydrolase
MVRLLLTGIFILASGPVIGGEQDPPREAVRARLTIATFNINYANTDLREVAAAISRSSADVVALQETNAESEKFLRRQLGRRYPHMCFRPPAGKYLASGFGFLSKVPLEDLKWLEPAGGLFGTWIVNVKVEGMSLQIANVHLSPFGPMAELKAADLLRELDRVEAIHEKEIQAIGKGLAPDRPVILLGDLNSLSAQVAPRFLERSGFSDSFASANKDPDSHPTWRWTMKDGSRISYRLDYLFHRGGLSTKESRIVETGASDHNLLVSVLEIVPGGGKEDGKKKEAARPPAE